jgi:alkanesulfonate monooxygenase SsuD/methylene tetrahydromethanopterin reductase-like flavin-dependent oxidoreductase (luciferase family)
MTNLWMTMELGIISLSDIQTDPVSGQRAAAVARVRDAVGYAVLADQAGLDVFTLGEHYTPDFAVAAPAVVLAAVAARTERIRLASGVTVLSVADPVRVYQDFAQLDLVSGGRAEIVAGRSAFPEPFAIFGVPLTDYDAVFDEKLLSHRQPSHLRQRRKRGNRHGAASAPAEHDPHNRLAAGPPARRNPAARHPAGCSRAAPGAQLPGAPTQ